MEGMYGLSNHHSTLMLFCFLYFIDFGRYDIALIVTGARTDQCVLIDKYCAHLTIAIFVDCR